MHLPIPLPGHREPMGDLDREFGRAMRRGGKTRSDSGESGAADEKLDRCRRWIARASRRM
jgi:hypothetical protein